MGDRAAGHPTTEATVLVTREVRWFAPGDPPDDVLEWFTGNGAVIDRARRIDRYDTTSARLGIGVKRRGHESVDAKYRLAFEEADLGNGLRGVVEDWVKISRPTPDDATLFTESALVAVEKELMTRTFPLPSASDRDAPTGCEVELSRATSMGRPFWSLCFETYGHPGDREAALLHGITSLLRESPIPEGLIVVGDDSCGYPAWISLVSDAA